MKSLKWIVLSALIVLGLMPLYGQGFNGSINYQDFTKSSLTQGELSSIPLALLAGEYWYYEAERWKTQFDYEFLKGAEKDKKYLIALNEIKVWQNQAEENKPSWLQHPITITVMVGLAFAAGLAIGL